MFARVDVYLPWRYMAPKSELQYSQDWAHGVNGDGQGKTGLIMVSTKEIPAIPIVIDQVIPVSRAMR